MFDSARSILDKYIDTEKVSRFTFYSIEMERGENPEDLFYICTIKNHVYVVFETDYIMNTLADVAREATDIFEGYGLTPLHWMVRKDSQTAVGAPTIPIGSDNADKLRESLITDKAGSTFGYAVRYGVIEFTPAGESRRHRFHPTTYGKVS